MLVESWKFLCWQQCLVKTPVNCCGETCRISGQKTSLCVNDGSLQSRIPRWHCEGWFRILRSIYITRIISITNDSKSHGYHIQTARVRRTSSWCSICWNPGLYQNTYGRNHGPVWKIQSFLLSGICTVILGRTIMGTAIWESSLKYDWEKVPNWECLFVYREKTLLQSVYVDDFELAGKKQDINPMWKVLNEEVDMGKPTSFLDHVYLGCTQRPCEISKDIVDNYRISAGATEKLPYS